jgi:hypothetical protein
MGLFIKQSTAVTLAIGPFVDSTDGVTAETALTLSQADVRLSKNGGAFAQKNESSSSPHMENGYYAVALNTTDTNTLGVLKLAVSESGALPVWVDCMVVPANVWDSLFGADKLQVHVDEMTANIVNASALATDAVTEIQSGLATASAVATIAGYLDTEIAAILAAVDTEVAAIKAKTDNLPTDPADDSDIDAQLAAIAGYLDTEIAAIKAKTDNLPAAPAAVGDIPTAAQIADAVLDEPIPEPSGVFTWAGSLRNIIGWLGALGRNKTTQTATLTTLRNDADSADIATSTVDDTAGTFTREEWS